MSDITLSKAVRSNLLSLQNTASMMAKTQERLATGNKVNSALDNPTNFFTASALNSRAGDINQLLDGMANGIQTIKAADNGLTAITKTLESMQSTLRQARQDKSFQTQSLDMTAFRDSTTLAGTEQLTFTGGSVGSAFSIDLTKPDPNANTPATNANLLATTAISAVTTGAAVPTPPADLASSGFTNITIGAGETASFDVNGTTITLDENGGTAGLYTASDIATIINNTLPGGSTVSADGSSGELVLSNTATGAAAEITLDNFGGEFAGAGDLGFASASSVGDDGTAGTSGGVDASAGDITFDINGETVTLAQTGGTNGHWSAAQVRDAINTQVGTGAGVTASLQGGMLQIRSTGTAGLTDAVALTNFTGGASASTFGFAAASAAGTDAVADPNAVVAKTVDELVTEINRRVDGNGDANPLYGNVRASNDNGKLRIQNLSTTDLDMQGVTAEGAIDGTSTTDVTIDGNAVRSDLANQFRELRDQLDKLADDASFNGINLLRGDNLQITFNETSTSELNIRSKDEQGISSSVLKLETNLQASDLDSDANIDTLIAGVKTAINTVRSQSSAFGSSLSIVQNRQDFSKNMINTLQTGASNLTLADMNEEAANLLALQTRQSLSSSALSMASQADQSVLQLLR